MSIKVVTFGCRLNIYESQIIEKHAKQAGLSNTIIFNSCAVTQEAERKLQQAIRKARNEMPDRQIMVTGCASQISTKKYADMPEVDTVFGNHEKLKYDTYEQLLLNNKSVIMSDIMSIKESVHYMIDGINNKSRAFLQIQNGCNHRCTFCTIPYGRGNSRSVPVQNIITYAKNLESKGYQELVLTGVDLTDYGLDLPEQPRLGTMLDQLLKMVPGIKRLRLSSIDVAEIDKKLFNIIVDEPRLMPHLHLSLQSGDDLILKRMKRRHSAQQVIDFCRQVCKLRPQIVLGADIIAGFPTETDQMFQNTYNLIEQLNIVHLHVFPYSSRKNTPAAKMPQTQGHIIKNRAKILRSLKDNLMTKFILKKIGKKESVLAESKSYGYTEDYCRVLFTQDLQRGHIHQLKFTSIIGHQLVS